MWYSTNYYLPSNLTTKGHVLAIDPEILGRFDTLQKVVDFLAESYNRGYTIIVLLPYNGNDVDSVNKNNLRATGIAKSLERKFPVIMITGNQGMNTLWSTMKRLIQIRSVTYIGTGTNDVAIQDLIIGEGGKYYTEDHFFPRTTHGVTPTVRPTVAPTFTPAVRSIVTPAVRPTVAPTFDLTQYLASKTTFNLVLEEPIESNLRIISSRPISIQVDRSMYQKILNGPTTSYKSGAPHLSAAPDTQGNAYFFGPEFPIDQYKYIMDHYNNAAATGFIDYDLGINFNTFDYRSGRLGNSPMERLLEEYDYEYDNRELLLKIRDYYPQVIWIGETEGGDSLVELFAHYTNGEIDSLLVNAEHFPGPEDSI